MAGELFKFFFFNAKRGSRNFFRSDSPPPVTLFKYLALQEGAEVIARFGQNLELRMKSRALREILRVL